MKHKLASHIELYQRTEAKIAGKILSADSPPWICTLSLRTPSSEFHRHQLQILDMQMTHFINRRIYKFFQSYTHIYLFIRYFHAARNLSTDTLMKLGPATTSPQPRRTIRGWVWKLLLWYFPSLCVITVLNKKKFKRKKLIHFVQGGTQFEEPSGLSRKMQKNKEFL